MADTEFHIGEARLVVGRARDILIRSEWEKHLFDTSLQEVDSYVKPVGLEGMVKKVERFPLTLLVGEDGIGKAGVAKLLARELQKLTNRIAKTYRARESDDWSFFLPFVASSESTELIVLAPDVSLEEIGNELADIAHYARERRAKLLLTIDKYNYDLAKSTAKLDYLHKVGWHEIKVEPSKLYPSQKLGSLLDSFLEHFEIGGETLDIIKARQKEILSDLRDPSKIRRFVLLSQQVRRLDLRRLQTLLAEAKELSHLASSWVDSLNLDQSLFATALAMFPELRENEFFDLYEELVQAHWHHRRPDIRLLDYRDVSQLSPYIVVTPEGTRFGDSDFQSVVSGRLIQAHRRAIISILPFLKQRVIGPEDDRQDQNKQMRIASALAIGEIAKVDLELVRTILRPIVEHHLGRVRAATGHILRRALEERKNESSIISLLKSWSRDANPDVRWAAASAFGRIGRSRLRLVLPELRWMAERDLDSDVRKSVAYAFRVLAMSRLDEHEVLDILKLLAADDDREVREEVATVFQILASVNINQAKQVLSNWLMDPQIWWTASLALVQIGISRPDLVASELVQFAASSAQTADILRYVVGRVVRSVTLSEGMDGLLLKLIKFGDDNIRQTLVQAIEFALKVHDPEKVEDVQRACQKASEICSMLRKWVVHREEKIQTAILTLLRALASANPISTAKLMGEILSLDDSELGNLLLERVVVSPIDPTETVSDVHSDLLYACALAPLRREIKSQLLFMIRKSIAHDSATAKVILNKLVADLSSQHSEAFDLFGQLVAQKNTSDEIQTNLRCLQTIAGCAVEQAQEAAITWSVMQVHTKIGPEIAKLMIRALVDAPSFQVRKLGLEVAYILITETHESEEDVLARLARSTNLRLDEVHERLGEDLFKTFYKIRKRGIEDGCDASIRILAPDRDDTLPIIPPESEDDIQIVIVPTKEEL